MLFSIITKFVATVAVLSQVSFAAPTVESLQTQALTSHNTCRTKHHVAAVRWSQKLADHAASVTETCIFAHKVCCDANNHTFIQHGLIDARNWSKYCIWPPSMRSVVDAWYNEVKDYNYNSGGSLNGKVIGYFTQVVWKGTTEIGCASKACPNLGGAFYVCDYSPPGNYIGQNTANVFKP